MKSDIYGTVSVSIVRGIDLPFQAIFTDEAFEVMGTQTAFLRATDPSTPVNVLI